VDAWQTARAKFGCHCWLVQQCCCMAPRERLGFEIRCGQIGCLPRRGNTAGQASSGTRRTSAAANRRLLLSNQRSDATRHQPPLAIGLMHGVGHPPAHPFLQNGSGHRDAHCGTLQTCAHLATRQFAAAQPALLTQLGSLQPVAAQPGSPHLVIGVMPDT